MNMHPLGSQWNYIYWERPLKHATTEHTFTRMPKKCASMLKNVAECRPNSFTFDAVATYRASGKSIPIFKTNYRDETGSEVK